MTYRTMQLNPQTWDLTTDGSGNLAIAQRPLAVAQDVASACRVFQGECYYDNALGIPWQEEILGRQVTTGFVAQRLQTEAQKLPVVNQALAAVWSDKSTRVLHGRIRVTDNDGNELQVNL